MLGEIFNVGDRVTVPRHDSITRDLWGSLGIIDKVRYDSVTDLRGNEIERNRMVFVRFDNPAKSIGAVMTGVWLRNCLVQRERFNG